LLEESLSDHRYIAFELLLQKTEIVYNITKKYKTKNINWEKFDDCIQTNSTHIANEIQNTTNATQLDHFVENFTTVLTTICDQTIPKASKVKNKKSNKWWTPQLSDLRHITNRSRRRYQRCQTVNREQLRLEYQDKRNRFKQLIIESKINSWNEFVVNNTRDNPWGLIYKISSNKLKSTKICELINDNGELITETKLIANEFLDTFFPNDSTLNDNLIHKNIREESALDIESDNDLNFTEHEIAIAIDQQNPNKSPGEDGLTSDIIKRFNTIEPKILHQLYNKCLHLGHFPTQWKSSVLRITPKTGRKDYRLTNAYRPISLLSVMAKTLEKLFINRITYFLKKNKLLNERQFGFTVQTSTEDALNSLTNFIQNGFHKKGFVMVLSIDIDGAFNHCWWPKVINQLRIKRCPKNLFNICKSYFNNRLTKLWFQNQEFVRQINTGCPQGGAASPQLWNICIDDIFDIELPQQTEIEAFADDIIVKIFGLTIEEIKTKAMKALDLIKLWALNNKLKFNPNKTQCVLFTKNLNYPQIEITIDGKVLEIVKQFKHLGLIIDSKLSWRQHIDYISKKGMTLTTSLLQFAKQKHGLKQNKNKTNQRALEIIYKGGVLPTISYACSVWYKAIDRCFALKPLQSMQRLIGLRIIKGYKTVSIEAVNTIANLMPIDLNLKYRATLYYIKKGTENDLTQFYFGSTGIDITNVQKAFDLRNALHYANRKPVIVEQTEPQNRTCIYTDRSKSNRGVGSGFCVKFIGKPYKSYKYKLAKYCSVFQSELFAIHKALEFITYENYYNIEVTIITDSETALKALNNTCSTTTFVHNIHEMIEKLETRSVRISFHRIRAHTGNEGNSLADKLAKEAAVCHNRIAYDKYPLSFLKKTIYDKNIEIWDQRWKTTDKALTTTKFFPTIYDRKKVKKYFEPDFYVTQVITGHGKFNEYLKRFKIKDDNNCYECGSVDDSEHKVYYCKTYERYRIQLIRDMEMNNIEWPCPQHVLLNKYIFNSFKHFCHLILE
jgi:ribonuclease HI